MSILSTTQQQKRMSNQNNINISNTLTLRLGHGLTTTAGGQHSTTVMLDEPNNMEATNIEDMHMLMVNVEKIKRKMLGRVEGQTDHNLDYRAFENYQAKIEERHKINGTSSNVKKGSIEDFDYQNLTLDGPNNNLNVISFE